MEIENFVNIHIEKHPVYSIHTKNCQHVAVDFSEHFFGVRFLSQSKLARRLSLALGILGFILLQYINIVCINVRKQQSY
jgi:hypothetical protein